MELKDFIKSTITQIAESVDELNNEMPNKLIVNPSSVSGIRNIPYIELSDGYCRNIMNLDFDLTITAENTSGSHKIGVLASVIKIGGSKEEENANRAENKIRFSIPILLPSEKPK